MTITADHSFQIKPALGTAHMLDGSRLVMRLGMRMGAVTAVMVALLVWLAPGATWDSEVVLFKAALSVVSGCASAWMWQMSLPPAKPVVEVDIANMEVRVMRRRGAEPARIIDRCAFADLDAVDLNGRHFIMWNKGSRLLADITLSNATVHASLLAALRSVGKLA